MTEPGPPRGQRTIAIVASASVVIALLWWRASDGESVPRDAVTTTASSVPVAIGGLRFTDVSASAGLTERHSAETSYGDNSLTSGAAVADVFGSGRFDVFVTRFGKPNALYRNNGDGTFTDVAASAGVAGTEPGTGSSAAAFADFDGNGCVDLFVSAAGTGRPQLYMNGCEGTFTEEAAVRGIDVLAGSPKFGAQEHGVTVGDIDVDGDLDLLVLHWDQGAYLAAQSARQGLCTIVPRPPTPGDDPASGARSEPDAEPIGPNRSRLYRNDGQGRFEDVTTLVGLDFVARLPFTGQFADITDDGFPELFVAGDVCTSQLYRNEGGERFVDVTKSSGVGTDENGMGSVVRDLDADGDLDWLVTGISYPTGDRGCPQFGLSGCSGNRLYLNDGKGRFTDATDDAGLREGWWGWGVTAEDFDGDGRLEIAQTNGFENFLVPRGVTPDPYFEAFRRDPMRFWIRNGTRFEDAAERVGLDDRGVGHSLIPFDFDGDDDLDLLVGRSSDSPVLYRNDTPRTHHRLIIRLDDPTANGNRQGLGAEVTVVVGDRRIVSHVHTDGSYESQKPADLHIGLGRRSVVDRVEIRWPGKSRVQVVNRPPVDRMLLVTRDTA